MVETFIHEHVQRLLMKVENELQNLAFHDAYTDFISSGYSIGTSMRILECRSTFSMAAATPTILVPTPAGTIAKPTPAFEVLFAIVQPLVIAVRVRIRVFLSKTRKNKAGWLLFPRK